MSSFKKNTSLHYRILKFRLPAGKFRNLQCNKGFTLIELLVVFSVIGILSITSVVSFVTYNENQTLANATKDIRQTLSNAKSRAQSQVKPPECSGKTLEGYEVKVCPSTAQCPLSEGNYETVVVCGGERFLVDPKPGNPKKLPSAIKISGQTPQTVFFKVLQGGIEGDWEIALEGYGQTRYIIIDDLGIIYEE